MRFHVSQIASGEVELKNHPAIGQLTNNGKLRESEGLSAHISPIKT